jgi:beta-mannosidase
MFDNWKLQDFPLGKGLEAGILADDFDDSQWAPVDVPGDVHRAIMAAGWIQDPYYDRNEDSVRWMEDKEWWYRVQFDGPADGPAEDARDRLIFHGLDTYVTIYLNGHEIGTSQNMFREAVLEVSDRLRYGAPNTLALCFHPPLSRIPSSPGELEKWGRNDDRVFMRKAQFGYGWDWGPRLPTIGIWRPVDLKREQGAALAGVHFHTLRLLPDADQALVAVDVTAERFATDTPLEARIVLTTPDGSGTARYKIPLDGDHATAHLTVKNPALWWTHDLGEPALYTLTVHLVQDGVTLDTQEHRVGIRTIELDQSVDTEERGTRFFRFVLNGVPIFAKGANWIPADSFVGAILDDHYARLLVAARDANMNMLRIWGGGLYEHDAFYNLCNALGILIWQDFMFACAAYPEHLADFAAEVEAEARYQVRRLRNHPALALWCGNNENQWLHDQRYWDQPDYDVPGSVYYHEVLPRVVAELDGAIPYWPGSPYGGNDYNSQTDGDRHNWNVWHGGFDRQFGEQPRGDQGPEGVSYRRYAEDMGRFISEFGMHASPVLETLRRSIPEDQLYHHSPSMDHHNKDNPKNKGDNLMQTVTGLPDTLEDYIDFSMIAQAEGLKFGIEHYRRRKPHCSGTLFWQLNDCWPVLSWSVLDYYGFGKAGYFYSKRVYAPVLASFKPLDDGGLELWITNDLLQPVTDTVTVRLATFNGETLLEDTLAISVPANSSQPVHRWNAEELPGGPDRYVSARSAAEVFPFNRHFFAPIKDLDRTPTAPEISITPVNGHELQITLTASTYAYFVYVAVPDEHTLYSDNYFDMEAGETRTLTVINEQAPLTPDMVTVRWR